MPNKQLDTYNLLPGITHRFLEVCFEIIMYNKLNNGKYKSVKALCEHIDMSEQSFFYLKSDSPGRSVTVAKIANLVKLHNVDANYIFTGTGPKFRTTESQQVAELAKQVQALQASKTTPPRKKAAKKK